MPITRAYGQASQLGNTPAASNPVINGAFDIWQRGTSITIASNGSASYTADRWFNARNSTGQTVSRQATGDTTNLPNIQYCARVQRDSGSTDTTAIRLCTPFETVNTIPLVGKTATLSFYARRGANFSATSNIMVAQVITGTGTDQNVLTSGYTGIAYPFNNLIATLTTTWQRFSISGTFPTNVTEMSLLFYFVPTGTAGAADFFEITGVQIDVGSVALPFRRAMNTLQGELAACQRYYARFSNTSGQGDWMFGMGTGASSTLTLTTIKLPVTMRTYPTTIDYSSLGVQDSANSRIAVTNLAYNNATLDTCTVLATVASGITQFRPYFLHQFNNSTGYLGFSAEL